MRTARQILADAHSIAVVGASHDPLLPAHWVPAMLHEHGWRIIPVNQDAESLFGGHGCVRLTDIPEHVDVVLVFRPAHEAVAIVREAAAIGAKAVWLQLGIRNPQALELAQKLGLEYVEDTCIGMERAISGMVHSGYKRTSTVYGGIAPEPEKPAAPKPEQPAAPRSGTTASARRTRSPVT